MVSVLLPPSTAVSSVRAAWFVWCVLADRWWCEADCAPCEPSTHDRSEWCRYLDLFAGLDAQNKLIAYHHRVTAASWSSAAFTSRHSRQRWTSTRMPGIVAAAAFIPEAPPTWIAVAPSSGVQSL